MRKFLITIISLTVICAAVFGGIVVYTYRLTSKSKIAAEPTKVAESQTPEKSPVSDPNQHDTFDVEFAKKLVLYHELAAQLDDYAEVNATQPEIRAFAQAKSVYNTEQSNI